MRKLSASHIFDGKGGVLKEHAVVLEDDGRIVEVLPTSELNSSEVESYDGCLMPGFVNAHCHLELSHMKGVIPSGTGLIPFIKTIISERDFPEEVILNAIAAADREMQDNGIVAVGDISNMPHTIETKRNSPIEYYNFVECFDLLQSDNAQQQLRGFRDVYDQFMEAGLKRTAMVPHAPYSVSERMFELLGSLYVDGSTVSLHNLETPAENDLFRDGSGELTDFFAFVGIYLSDFAPTGRPSMEYALSHMNPTLRTLLVHNTISTHEDIEFAQRWGEKVFWCTCPSANLYIENRLPVYRWFVDSGSRVCIGTDSLASNWQLSILEEMKLILKLNSDIPLEELVKWGTYNGARALGMDDEIGTIEKGKKPGLNLVEMDVEGDRIPSSAKVKKLI